jgi:DNA invertase Pin-like site-specific DNA recombinase
MKLTAYLRVSTAGQVRDGLGLPTQERLIKAWAKANGHTIAAVRKDEGVSGANGIDDRIGLPLVLADIRDRRAEAVVVSSMDRLARALTVQEAILGTIWKLGGKLYAVDAGEITQDDPDDPMRTAMRQMAGVFAQLDRALVIKRLRNGRQTKAQKGGYAYGSPAFGQKAEGKGLVPDQDELAAVQRIAQLHRQGRSLREIIIALEAEGVPPKRGGRWYPATVSRVLARLDAS